MVKDRDMLGRQLCKYYDERNLVDVDHLPKVTRKKCIDLKNIIPLKIIF